jgi:hypothetical protein
LDVEIGTDRRQCLQPGAALLDLDPRRRHAKDVAAVRGDADDDSRRFQMNCQYAEIENRLFGRRTPREDNTRDRR